MQARYTRLALAGGALIAALAFASDGAKKVDHDQFENLLRLKYPGQVKEIMAMPLVEIGQPFVLRTTDKKFAAICHCEYGDGGYVVDTVKVLLNLEDEK